MKNKNLQTNVCVCALTLMLYAISFTVAWAQPKKPNIVVIFGDDIGYWNAGAYSHGMMGRTPHIDRIAKEGMLFTDHYRQPSCTAGCVTFLTGQMPIRRGMTTIGVPGSASLADYPPHQTPETLSMKKAAEAAIKKMESFHSNHNWNVQ